MSIIYEEEEEGAEEGVGVRTVGTQTVDRGYLEKLYVSRSELSDKLVQLEQRLRTLVKTITDAIGNENLKLNLRRVLEEEILKQDQTIK